MARGTLVSLVALATLVLTSLAWAASGPGSSQRSSSRAAAVAGQCSKSAALEIATRLQIVPDPTLPSPIATVLCGSFTGAGSQAMVAVFARGTCLPSSGWAVFRSMGGTWRLVMQRTGFSTLAVAGPDIRETVPVWRRTDPPCNPGGGTKSRLWHWNGSRLVAGPWKRSTPGNAGARGFLSPSGNIACGMFDDDRGSGVVCQSRVPPQKVTMDHTGRVSICRDPTPRNTSNECGIGDPGESKTPTLAYGRHIIVGRFRCDSLVTGVKCVATTTGKGFLINRDGVRRVGP